MAATGEPNISKRVPHTETLALQGLPFAASLAELQAEASCPICLDYLRDPVTTDCGHNFCGSCIRQRWEDLQDILPCPVCFHHCRDRNFKRNVQLGHVADLVRQLPAKRNKRRPQEEKALCERHGQALTLFCEKDLELLCPRCKVSSGHQGHPLTPIKRAAAGHRKQLKSYREPLRKQAEDTEKGLDMQVSEAFEFRTKIKKSKGKLHSDFKQFKSFLKEKNSNDRLKRKSFKRN